MPFSSSISPINPDLLFGSTFDASDQNIIPSVELKGEFIPEINSIEFFIYDFFKVLLSSDYDFRDWSIILNSNSSSLSSTDTIELDPTKNIFDSGFSSGILYALYNFINKELESSIENPYYISEISSDRTELKLKSNFIPNNNILNSYQELRQRLDSSEYFDELYINFGENQYFVGVNVYLDTSEEQYSILIKLYESLPSQYSIKDELYVVTKVGETQAYKVEFIEEDFRVDDIIYLKGPNTNLSIKDFINNSSGLKSLEELNITPSSGSKFNLQNYLNTKGISLEIDYSYTNFSEFVNFSSAKGRILNFIEKVEQIQAYEADISVLNNITGSSSSSYSVSSSIASAYTNIENLIKNFDGYEYYLYYNTSSLSYPKTGSIWPYALLPTSNVQVLNWLGDNNETSSYYGGILLSASLYDESNQNWLYYTIPEFIRDNSNNSKYLDFANMVGQHFDEIWLYTKAITQRLNTTNELDKGIPLELANEAITSLGFPGYGNNYNNQDNYIGLTGENDYYYLPNTGSELINNYIAVNNGVVINYWTPLYSYEYYVESLNNPGWPYPIDKVSKEIFKRLYHNLAYLVKKKGTISGLRQLINIWGIPNTILKISEFGGKNKDNSDDYDLWYNRYNYAFNAYPFQHKGSASVLIPWNPLTRNTIAEGQYVVPDCIQFRFKTTGYPSSSYAGNFYTQSLLAKKSDGLERSVFDFGIGLFYNPPSSGSYSGSSDSLYKNWGTINFFLSGSLADGGVIVSDDIYLPFFDGGWWSVMLQRDSHAAENDNNANTTYTLYVKNKIYNGYDGNSIGFEGSSSIYVDGSETSRNAAWNSWGFVNGVDGVYLGGYISGVNVGDYTLNESGKLFSGSLQEFRYYAYALSESIFNDYVMNPESIEGINITGSLSSFDILNFRAPLGNELETMFLSSLSSSYSESLTSYHPAITGSNYSLITSSFINPLQGDATSSLFNVIYYSNSSTKVYSKTNRETVFLDQPAIGLRNRISNKIQVVSGSSYGNVLSNQISIQQNYEISQSYTKDINTLEVAFSPQNEINDDIIQTFGYGVVADALADPRNISSSDDYYPQLRRIAQEYFKKYTKSNVYDYIRLIKYFDNSIFKAIKNYVPARTNVMTGIVIKQHLLERNRYREPSITQNNTLALTPSGGFNTPLVYQNLELNSSLSVSSVTGSTGGIFEQFNYSGSPNFFQTPITQSWNNTFDTVVGLRTITESYQREFYDGELSGSVLIVTTQSLNPKNTYKKADLASYYIEIYGNAQGVFGVGDTIDITGSLSPITASVVDFRLENNDVNRGVLTIKNLSGIFPVTSSKAYVAINNFGVGGDGEIDEIYSWQYVSKPDFTYNDNNALLNNCSENRLNSYLMVVDYESDAMSPTNLDSILLGNATKAQTPDSNYACRRVINPRYNGSRVSSADYNTYTPSGSVRPASKTSLEGVLPNFLNGDTGSWAGDVSYGKTAVVEKNPIYFAHFKSSKENREVWDTYTFRIDTLIEVPSEDIQGQNIIPKTLKLEGGTDKIYEVVNSFEKNRHSLIDYNSPIYNSIKYTSTIIDNNKIFQGGMEYNLLLGTEANKNIFVTTCSFVTSSWGVGLDPTGNITHKVTLTTGSYGKNYYIETGSNSLILMGGSYQVTASWDNSYNYYMVGPGLGLIHSLNYAVKNGLTASNAVSNYKLGTPPGGVLDPNDESNYWKYNPTSSGLSAYEDFNIPFLLERGDEIRVTYNIIYNPADSVNPIGLQIPQTIDFTVLGITNLSSSGLASDYLMYVPLVDDLPLANSVYSKILVSPNPSTLNIPDGKIDHFTVRRRMEKDDRVILYKFPVTGSRGTLTPSGEGFLVPNDLSPTQKRNIQSLINELKAKNTFKDDDNPNLTT